MKEKFKNKNKKGLVLGFTLVEALVAVSIILIGVTAAFGTAQFGLSSTSAIRNRITAVFLAQEAMEAVKNRKDSNLLAKTLGDVDDGFDPDEIHWLEGLTKENGGNGPCPSGGAPCSYSVGVSFESCANSQGCRVVMVTDNDPDTFDFYQQLYNGGKPTGFIREIFIEETGVDDVDDVAKVTVTISREDGNFTPFTVVSLIYNWF